MRWAMKPGESLISVTLVPALANIAAAASRTCGSPLGGIMIVMRLLASPVRSTATVRFGIEAALDRGGRGSPCRSAPPGSGSCRRRPRASCAPAATTSSTSFSLWLSITTALGRRRHRRQVIGAGIDLGALGVVAVPAAAGLAAELARRIEALVVRARRHAPVVEEALVDDLARREVHVDAGEVHQLERAHAEATGVAHHRVDLRRRVARPSW